MNRKLKEHFEEAIRTYVDDLPEKGDFLNTQLHEDWVEKKSNKPVFQYREEESVTSPVARLKAEREERATWSCRFYWKTIINRLERAIRKKR